MRSKSGFSFFSKMTSSKRQSSFSIPTKKYVLSEVDRTIDHVAETIEKWNTEYVSTTQFYSLFSENKREAKKFVKHVKELQNSMDLLIREDPNSESLIRAQKLMQLAMKRLQSEFLQILSMNRSHLDPKDESRLAGASIIEVEEMSKENKMELKSIADCMMAAGYAKECVSTYKSIRKSIVDEAINRLGVEKISSSKAKKMPSEVVELKMKLWKEAVKVSMKTLFNGERTLCDEVFESSDTLRESCFRDISKEGALLLFGFPEIVAVRDKKNPRPERVFPLLDLYSYITEYLPAIESIFSFQSTSVVRSQVLNSLNRIGEVVLLQLVEFESEIRKDSSKTVVLGGGVHPLTISAMDYLSRLAEYNKTLMDIHNGRPSSAKSLLPKSYFNASDSDGSPESEVRLRFAWMILVLLCKIDAKAELYKELSTQYLFLANNLQHVTSHALSTNLKQILGEEWIARHFDKVKQFVSNYERLAWGPVASMCPSISTSDAVDMNPEEVKIQFDKFNEIFERTCESQSACAVPNLKLRGEICNSIERMLLPIYRDFYNAHRNAAMLAGTEDEWNVRYTPEGIINHMSELFTCKGFPENPSEFCVLSQVIPTRGRKHRSLSCRKF